MSVTKTYSNSHGTLTLETVREFEPVRTFKRSDDDKQFMFDIETAEKIAAITDNCGIQISFCFPFNGLGYVLLHDGPSIVALCKVVLLEWRDKTTARQVINDARRETVYGYGVM